MDWHIYAGDWARYAEQEILKQYGDVVSFFSKGKSLHKFGRCVTQSTARHTIMELPTGAVEETLLDTNGIDELSSSSASDNSKVFTLEGHTINLTTGVKTFVTQNVTCLGTTPATLTTPLARCTRMFVTNGTFASPAANTVGDIYVYASSGVTVTDGVPQTASAVKCRITAGNNESLKCATSLSSTDYWCVREIDIAMLKATGAGVNADFDLLVRELGGVWRRKVAPIQLDSDVVTTLPPILFEPWLIIPPNSDVRMTVTASASGADVTATMTGALALVA